MEPELINFANRVISYVTDCKNSESIPTTDSLPSHLLDRGILFAVHVPCLFPKENYKSWAQFISDVIRGLSFKGAYYFRTEGFYKEESDYDHFRVISHVRAGTVPVMIERFKERLKKLQKETRQECLFLSVGQESAFFDCWADKNPGLLLEQQAELEKSYPDHRLVDGSPTAFSRHTQIIIPDIVVISGFSGGEFMERLKKGVLSMARLFNIEPKWTEVNESRSYIQALEQSISSKPNIIIIHHGHTGNDSKLQKNIESLIKKAIEYGIKIVTFDTRLDIDDVLQVAQDDMFMGILLARVIHSRFYHKEKVGVLYLNDAREFLPLQNRDYTWSSALKCYPRISMTGHCNIDVFANYEKKKSVIKNTLLQNLDAVSSTGDGPRIQAVAAMWDEFAKPAVAAVKELTEDGILRHGEVEVFSMDLVEEDLEIMKQERQIWRATVATDPFQIGRVLVRAATIITQGEYLRPIIMEPSLITSDDLFELPAHSISDLQVFRGFRETEWAWRDWMPRD